MNNPNLKEDVIFTDEILEYIITDFTEDESGVRNLKRCLEIIYTKLNLYRLMKPEENLFQTSLKIYEKSSISISTQKEVIDKLLNKTDKNDIPFGIYNNYLHITNYNNIFHLMNFFKFENLKNTIASFVIFTNSSLK